MENNLLLESAHRMRRLGKYKEALESYDKLLSEAPTNDEYIFGKALCFLDTEPLLAIKLFKKVIDINPNVTPAYGNIIVAAKNANQYSEAIEIFNDFITKFPQNLELVYQRAILKGNNGEILRALLDCYHVIENSQLKDDSALFLKHPISQDIAFGKVQLRNITLQEKVDIETYNKYCHTSIKEYHYVLPTKLFGDENYYIDFGKFLGYSTNEVLKENPQYLIWCVLNLNSFALSEDLISMINSTVPNYVEAKKLNTLKLFVFEKQKHNNQMSS